MMAAATLGLRDALRSQTPLELAGVNLSPREQRLCATITQDLRRRRIHNIPAYARPPSKESARFKVPHFSQRRAWASRRMLLPRKGGSCGALALLPRGDCSAAPAQLARLRAPTRPPSGGGVRGGQGRGRLEGSGDPSGMAAAPCPEPRRAERASHRSHASARAGCGGRHAPRPGVVHDRRAARLSGQVPGQPLRPRVPGGRRDRGQWHVPAHTRGGTSGRRAPLGGFRAPVKPQLDSPPGDRYGRIQCQARPPQV